MMEKKHIDEAYLASLSEEELLKEQKNWTAKQWQQYYCPNGTITLDEFCDYAYKLIDKYFPE